MDKRSSVHPFLLVLGAMLLLGGGVLIGVLINQGGSGGPVKAGSIGDATRGRELFVSQGCAMCHSYEGRGGTDGPSLDSMRGEMSAADIADMSGTLWNHLPAMKAAFAGEHIPFPAFQSNQMADLIAYLHGGGPPPDVSKGGAMGSMEGK